MIKVLRLRFATAFGGIKTPGAMSLRTLRAGAWTIGSQFASQALRLGGNLILTRLLFPEAFGLMAVVQSISAGLSMFTDLGVESSIIQHRRGHEQDFVNTAWTVQVVQGGLIWLALCACALPAAALYHQPLLTWLMPAVGFNAVIGGFLSTDMALATRNLDVRKRIMVEVGSYAFGLLIMITWAWFDHSVWALVGGGLAGTTAKTLASHAIHTGPRNRLHFARDSFGALFRFGQWVLLSSVITFTIGEGNKLIIGGFIGVKMLAFFTLAATMCSMFWQVVTRLNSYVLFPAYAELERTRPERLKGFAERVRLLLLLPAWLLALFFVFFGDRFMDLLYDRRYVESGHILQMLALGDMLGIAGATYVGLLWAKGMVKLSTIMLGCQSLLGVIGMMAGNHFFGMRGVIVGIALVPALVYPVTAWMHARVGLWQPKIDLPFITASLVIAACRFSALYAQL